MVICIKETKDIQLGDIVEIYRANKWSSAEKPDKLIRGLLNSHSFITAWHNERLVGLGNALSDGYLVVYYPHLIVHPSYHRKGIGTLIMNKFKEKYGEFHQQILISDAKAINFYKTCGFEQAVKTAPMWVYQGGDQ